VELTRAETVLAAEDTDCAGAAAIFGALFGAVADDPAATVVAELAGTVADVVAAAGLETLAAAGDAVVFGLGVLGVDACDCLAIPDKAAEIPLVSMLSASGLNTCRLLEVSADPGASLEKIRLIWKKTSAAVRCKDVRLGAAREPHL